MRRVLIFVAVCVCAINASAQWNALSGVLQKLTGSSSETTKTTTTSTTTDNLTSTATDALKNVLGSLIGNSMPVSEATINGVWNYEGVSCVLESENALANIGGSAAAGTIEGKLDGYLAKVGVAPGACTFAFLDGDSCTFTVKGHSLNGTYVLNSQDKTVALNFYGYVSMTAHVSYNLSNLELVFEADKLLALIKKATSLVSSNSGTVSSLLGGASGSATTGATLQAVSGLLDNYTGMMLGMKLSK